MYNVKFKEVYSKKERKINENSPEILFLKDICKKNPKVDSFINEKTICGSRVFLDAPNGRFNGVQEIQQFSENWLSDFDAVSASVYPVIQTIANGRVATELEMHFELKDGTQKQMPMVIVADLAGNDRIEGIRIYFFYLFLPGAIGYRKPIFIPQVKKPCEYPILTGSVRAYYEALHNPNSPVALESIMDIVSDDIVYGGFRPEEIEPMFFGKDEVRTMYENICNDWPKYGYIRFETFIDDGVTCLAEWTAVLTKEGVKNGMVCFAGCASYERDSDGKLYSIRICDNNGCDIGIDPKMIPQEMWFVE